MNPPAPPEVCAVKMTLRIADAQARYARKRWYAWREEYATRPDTVSMTAIGSLTTAMWTAEAALAAAATEWRNVLAERAAAMPVAERWNLAALEKWAQAQVETL